MIHNFDLFYIYTLAINYNGMSQTNQPMSIINNGKLILFYIF